MIIVKESKKDYDEVYNVVKYAFLHAEHRDGNEQDIVNDLRNGEAYIPELSLVAKIDDKIVGHIMFTEGKVGDNKVLILAPLSVLPEFQRQGVGSSLIKEGHKKAIEMGYEYSMVLGSELYYPKFGYEKASKFNINVPDGIPSINFMAIKLVDNAKGLRGNLIYPKEFR